MLDGKQNPLSLGLKDRKNNANSKENRWDGDCKYKRL